MGAETVSDHADYRLLGKSALEGLSQFGESNLFLRGIVPLIGFSSCTVEYERSERIAGDTHYPLRKMLHLAIDGVTSLSVKPIHIISAIGVIFGIIGLLGIAWAFIASAMGETVHGWSSTICVICLIGGIQLFSLGVIGEYIGKIYLETKERPRYLIRERTSEFDQTT